MAREYALDDFAQQIHHALLASDMVEEEEINLLPPPDGVAGDLGLPCFLLARRLRRSPAEIAAELADKVSFPKDGLIAKVDAVGPYLNFSLHQERFTDRVLREVRRWGDHYGSDDRGQGKTVVIDYSSPNIARRMHIGHVRSTVIGQALRNLYDFLGYRTVGDNHLGDWGTQFGKLIHAYQAWGDEEAMAADPIEHLIELYARFHREAEEHPELEEKGRDWFRRLEEGDPEARRLWQWFVDLTIRELEKTYQRLGIQFDTYHGESFYEPLLEAVVEEALESEAAQADPDSAAVILDLTDYDLPSTLLRKSDGATLYMTRELATALYRLREYNPALILYVVGQEQTLHFRQIRQCLRMMGYEDLADRCVHVSFGSIVQSDGERFSMRRGDVIYLDELLDDAEARARAIIEEKNPDLPAEQKEEIARQVGIGALIYNDLYQDRRRDITFDWDAMLSFEGNSAPYIQYTHTRCSSVLEKGGGTPQACDAGKLAAPQEQALVKQLARLPRIVQRAAEEYAPHVVAEWLHETARDFGQLWRDLSILQAPEETRQARLCLVSAVGQGIRNGLRLLGIEAPTRM